MSKFTPGPWEADVMPNGTDLSITAGDMDIVGGCGCCGSPWTDSANAEGNARLIAAAPDLYALALDVCENYYQGMGDEQSVARLAKRLISKIDGDSND